MLFHLRMPPPGGIAESRYDIQGFLNNLNQGRGFLSSPLAGEDKGGGALLT